MKVIACIVANSLAVERRLEIACAVAMCPNLRADNREDWCLSRQCMATHKLLAWEVSDWRQLLFIGVDVGIGKSYDLMSLHQQLGFPVATTALDTTQRIAVCVKSAATKQMTQQSDPALDAFDRLRVRRVIGQHSDTASTFLAKFQPIAASLEPDERIALAVASTRESVELMRTVLSDPQASKICSLQWWYDGKEDVNSIIPLLIDSCPELASLVVDFKEFSAFDFVSSVLEHSSNKIKVLTLPRYATGNIPRFFVALGQSQVSALALFSAAPLEFAQGLHEYLAKDLLVRLKVWMSYKQVPSAMIMSLADCTRLIKLGMFDCEFSQSAAFPKSTTKLELENCTFVGGFDWSFLAGSNVRELDFYSVKGVDGNQPGDALSVHLRAKGLDKLRFFKCDFADETLAVVGAEVGRIKRLEIGHRLNNASIKLIALALQAPNNAMKELVLEYVTSSIETHLVPALEHPNCNLVKLSLPAYPGHEEAAKTVEDMFYKRLALFTLLQGRQVKRRHCPLRRLPVEMFRLVGKALI